MATGSQSVGQAVGGQHRDHLMIHVRHGPSAGLIDGALQRRPSRGQAIRIGHGRLDGFDERCFGPRQFGDRGNRRLVSCRAAVGAGNASGRLSHTIAEVHARIGVDAARPARLIADEVHVGRALAKGDALPATELKTIQSGVAGDEPVEVPASLEEAAAEIGALRVRGAGGGRFRIADRKDLHAHAHAVGGRIGNEVGQRGADGLPLRDRGIACRRLEHGARDVEHHVHVERDALGFDQRAGALVVDTRLAAAGVRAAYVAKVGTTSVDAGEVGATTVDAGTGRARASRGAGAAVSVDVGAFGRTTGGHAKGQQARRREGRPSGAREPHAGISARFSRLEKQARFPE